MSLVHRLEDKGCLLADLLAIHKESGERIAWQGFDGVRLVLAHIDHLHAAGRDASAISRERIKHACEGGFERMMIPDIAEGVGVPRTEEETVHAQGHTVARVRFDQERRGRALRNAERAGRRELAPLLRCRCNRIARCLLGEDCFDRVACFERIKGVVPDRAHRCAVHFHIRNEIACTRRDRVEHGGARKKGALA